MQNADFRGKYDKNLEKRSVGQSDRPVRLKECGQIDRVAERERLVILIVVAVAIEIVVVRSSIAAGFLVEVELEWVESYDNKL